MVPRTAVAVAGSLLALLFLAAPSSAAELHVLKPDGRTVVRHVRGLPPADPLPSRAAAARAERRVNRLAARAAKTKTTFARTVQALFAAGQIDELTYDAARDAAAQTRSLLRKVPKGGRKDNLQDILDQVDSLAAADEVTAARVPVLTEIVARNNEYWGGSGALLSYGARVSFPGSRIVWQYYPGYALQPQWLGTFGFANSKASSKSLKKSVTADTTETLDEALTLATPRAGGIAWESFFAFSGAPPVWVSAITQGTAISAYAHAGAKLARPDYMTDATNALGVFKTPPPEGVALPQDDGAHYLMYSTNSKLLILNGFLQALTGLFDYWQLSQDPVGQQLFDQGNSEAQAEIPKYDTGAWSLYEGVKESSLSYHQLVTGFAQNLCDRTQTPIYCDTAARFTADETTPPAMRISTSKARTKKSVRIRFKLSKMSTVSMYVDDTPITSATLAYGTHTLSWAGTRKPGTYTVTLKARDLAGNTAEVSKDITLSRKG
jgi:hypothetical protein